MAADITTQADAETLAENLVPIDAGHATQKFFDEAVRSLYEEVLMTFIEAAPALDAWRCDLHAAKISKWLDRSVQVYEGRRHHLSSHQQVRSNLDRFVPFFFCFLRTSRAFPHRLL